MSNKKWKSCELEHGCEGNKESLRTPQPRRNLLVFGQQQEQEKEEHSSIIFDSPQTVCKYVHLLLESPKHCPSDEERAVLQLTERAATTLSIGQNIESSEIYSLLSSVSNLSLSAQTRSIVSRLLRHISFQCISLWHLDLAQHESVHSLRPPSPSSSFSNKKGQDTAPTVFPLSLTSPTITPSKATSTTPHLPTFSFSSPQKVILSAPTSPVGSPTSSPRTPRSTLRLPSISSSSPRQTNIICRICEMLVPRETITEHMKICERKAKIEMAITSAEHKIAEFRQKLLSLQCRFKKVDCLNDLISFASRIEEENDFFALVNISSKLKVSERPCPFIDKSISQLLSFLKEKQSAIRERDFIPAETITTPSTSTPKSRSSSRTSLPFSSISSTTSMLTAMLMLNSSSINASYSRTHGRPRSTSSSPPPLHLDRISSPRTTLSPSDFRVIKPITRGGYGNIYLVRKIQTGDIFALKVIDKASLPHKNTLSIERDILSQTENPFVVRMFYSFSHKDKAYFAMEYCPGGDLFSLLSNLGSLSLDMAAFYIAEIVLALEYLHSLGIVHRDIKPDNVLIAASGHIKLADFGLSQKGLISRTRVAIHRRQSGEMQPIRKLTKQCSEIDLCEAQVIPTSPVSKQQAAAGTPDYLSPECLLGLSVGISSDWWSLGCLLFELLTGTPPFNSNDVEIIFNKILQREIHWPSNLDPIAKDLIDKLLVLNPSDRIGSGKNGIKELKSHLFFKSIAWNSIIDEVAPFTPQLSDESDTSFFEARNQAYPLKETAADLEFPQQQQQQQQIESDLEAAEKDGLFFVNFSQLAHETRELLKDDDDAEAASSSSSAAAAKTTGEE